MLPESDHRRLGQELDLFHMQDEAPGAVFWHPRGLSLVRKLEEHVRRVLRADDYLEVRSPQVMREAIWKVSGHWDAFAGGMIRIDDAEEPAALKPVSCPAHIQIVKRARPSWRDLPLRIAELGVVHRAEPSGALHGLFRLRQFMQDDGHIFCAAEHVDQEIQGFLQRVLAVYAGFGFPSPEVALSLRPDVRVGDDALWDRAENALEDGAMRLGLACRKQPKQGAFYGPKIELVLEDSLGRKWQCGTVQLDFFLAERFGVRYVDKDGQRKPIVMIHRAMLGSFERFVGILLEHHGGKLPPWLAPVALRILPVSEAHGRYAEEVEVAMKSRGITASVDKDSSSLARRLVEALAQKIPILGVVGSREVARRSVVLREGEAQREISLDAALDEISRRVSPPGERM